MKPTPGKQYLTVQGDTLEKIASSAYGDPNKSNLILEINQTQERLTATSVISTNTTLIIPVDTDLNSIRQTQLIRGL